MQARIHFDEVIASIRRNMNDTVSLKDLFNLFLILTLIRDVFQRRKDVLHDKVFVQSAAHKR